MFVLFGEPGSVSALAGTLSKKLWKLGLSAASAAGMRLNTIASTSSRDSNRFSCVSLLKEKILPAETGGQVQQNRPDEIPSFSHATSGSGRNACSLRVF